MSCLLKHDPLYLYEKATDDEDFHNGHLTIRDIPEEAYAYVVNGKPALEWVMERQSVSKDNVQRHPQRRQPLGHRDDEQSRLPPRTLPPRHQRQPGDDEDREWAASFG